MQNSALLSCTTCVSSTDNITSIDAESIQTTASLQPEQSVSEVPQVTIDFGKVNIGAKINQTVRLENLRAGDISSYALIKDPNSNPIYQAFDFDNTDYPVTKSGTLEKLVTFHPRVPNEKYLDHFYLTLDTCYIMAILLKGECRGPRAQLSTTSLNFTRRSERQSVEILNTSEIRLTYQFDVNGTDYDIFQVNHPFGTIDSKQRKIISISFNPKKHGIYSKYLSCFILHHEPKIINLTGVFLTSPLKELKNYPKDVSETSGFTGFMSDSLTLLSNVPPFSLSQNFLDFGMVEIGNHKTLVTSLTNHMKLPITVTWINHDVFKISPIKIQIPSEESVLYEVIFEPDGSDSIFYIDLIGAVAWLDDKLERLFTLVPQSISLRLLGNSFFDHAFWVPQLQMTPESIIFPCCVPAFPTYSSFLLKATGYLPVSFKFVPPNRSNFIIKPMVGLVSCSQIIYAQFHPLNTQSKGYVERWEIELNGRTGGYGIPFFMKGFCQYPAITVAKDNTITFATMLPGAREKESVILKNTSAHFLQYEFVLSSEDKIHAHLEIQDKKGDLAANESKSINWFCTGDLTMPREVQVPFNLRFLQSCCKVIGTEITGQVTVRASCAEAKLCSVPNSWEFNSIKFDCKETATFKLFNFGESSLHFLLYHDDEHNVLDVSPTQGTIKPNDSVVINVLLNSAHVGKSQINIYYYLRVCSDSAELLSSISYKVFEITYTCQLASIQIADIEYHDYTALFNRLDLWTIMNIDNLNLILRTIASNETKEIDIFLPDYGEDKETHKTLFSLKNISEFDINLDIVRKQICPCKVVEKTAGISLRKFEYDCIHRDMVNIDISNNYLNANCYTTMTMKCRYIKPGRNTLCYILKLSNNRDVVLNIHIRTLGPAERVLSIYERNFDFILRDVFIGELDPFLQTYWVYNNTQEVIEYLLDLSEVNDLLYKNKFPIIECRNPMGYACPGKAYPLIFKFSPLEAVTYRLSIPINVNDQTVIVLKLTGKGLMHPKKIDVKVRHEFHKSTIYNSIAASVEHISLPPIGLWSEVHRVFYIKNYSADVTYYYSWQDCSIVGLVEVEYDNPKGIIAPKETHCIRMIVNSLQHACVTTLHVFCKLISQNEYIEHQRTVAEHHLMQARINGEFIITEQGEQQPQNTVTIKPMPVVDFLNMSVDVYIISTADRDLHMTGKEQLQKFPASFAGLKAMRAAQLIQGRGDAEFLEPKLLGCAMNNIADMLQTVLQMIVADAIYSKEFDYAMSELKTSLPPYHYQMKIDSSPSPADVCGKYRRLPSAELLVVRTMREPQRTMLRDVIGDLVQSSLNGVFKIGMGTSQKIDDEILVNIKQECVCPQVDSKGDNNDCCL